MEIAHAIRPRNLLVENVPGWLNMPDNAFGCFLGALVGADNALCSPLDGKWPSAGMVAGPRARSEEHTSELQSLMRISYAVFCLKKQILKMKHQSKLTNMYAHV